MLTSMMSLFVWLTTVSLYSVYLSRTLSISELAYWYSLLLLVKMINAISQSHSTLNSYAFFIRPNFLFVNVTFKIKQNVTFKTKQNVTFKIKQNVTFKIKQKNYSYTYSYVLTLDTVRMEYSFCGFLIIQKYIFIAKTNLFNIEFLFCLHSVWI